MRVRVSQVAINWCMCKGAVVIVGIKTAAQAAIPRLYSIHPHSATQYTPTQRYPVYFCTLYIVACITSLWAQAEENRGALGWELSGAEQLELEAAAAKVPKKATQNIFQTS